MADPEDDDELSRERRDPAWEEADDLGVTEDRAGATALVLRRMPGPEPEPDPEPDPEPKPPPERSEPVSGGVYDDSDEDDGGLGGCLKAADAAAARIALGRSLSAGSWMVMRLAERLDEVEATDAADPRCRMLPRPGGVSGR